MLKTDTLIGECFKNLKGTCCGVRSGMSLIIYDFLLMNKAILITENHFFFISCPEDGTKMIIIDELSGEFLDIFQGWDCPYCYPTYSEY